MDNVTARRSSDEHDPPMTKESIEKAIKDAIDTALATHRPKTDIKVLSSIAISFVVLLLTILEAWTSFSNRIAIIEERQNVNTGLILKLAERIDTNEALLHNNEAAISQTAQELHDHKELDNSRWERVGGKREKP